MDQELKNILTLASEVFREHGLHESAEKAEGLLQELLPSVGEIRMMLVKVDDRNYKVVAKCGVSTREVATLTYYKGSAHPWESLRGWERHQADTLEDAYTLAVFGTV